MSLPTRLLAIPFNLLPRHAAARKRVRNKERGKKEPEDEQKMKPDLAKMNSSKSTRAVKKPRVLRRQSLWAMECARR